MLRDFWNSSLRFLLTQTSFKNVTQSNIQYFYLFVLNERAFNNNQINFYQYIDFGEYNPYCIIVTPMYVLMFNKGTQLLSVPHAVSIGCKHCLLIIKIPSSFHNPEQIKQF